MKEIKNTKSVVKDVEEIKIAEGTTVTINGKSVFFEVPDTMFNFLNMKGPEYDELKTAIIARLLTCGHVDISAAYNDIIKVVIDLVPVK